MVRQVTLVAFVLFCLVAPSSAGDARYVIRTDRHHMIWRLGPWNIKGDHGPGRAVSAFGRPSSIKRYGPWCDYGWKRQGITATFHVKRGRCASVENVKVTGSRWQTGRGLHVGDPTSRLRALYPRAEFDGTSWDLTGFGSDASLGAVPRQGRVKALTVAYVWTPPGWGSRVQTPKAAGASELIASNRRGTVTALGDWQLTNPNLNGAIRAFGRPSATHHYHGLCRVSWHAQRLSAIFLSPPPRCHGLQWFQTASRSWRTEKGLRVGDPTSRIRELYPDAEWGGKQWTCLDAPGSFLDIEPRAGRVHAIRVVF